MKMYAEFYVQDFVAYELFFENEEEFIQPYK